MHKNILNMGVLKTLTDEYFGDSIRKEDLIDISGLDVEIVSFTDMNGKFHGNGYRIKDGNPAYMAKMLLTLIERIREKRGNKCSLNDIDVSNITQMCYKNYYIYGIFASSEFDGDISGWDVSNVESMSNMFIYSKFTGRNGIFRLEKGNKVENMWGMFAGSKFNGNISNWDVSNVESMGLMFSSSEFNGDLSKWNVQKVETMERMFSYSKFTGENGIFKLKEDNKVRHMNNMFESSPFEANISDWEINYYCNIDCMFDDTPLQKNDKLPQWYKNIQKQNKK